jgi:hypothetical protein
VPGYPRELEAIVLTAMANDPNARFQTGQEMIEALDAFAVRAKLTGSNTAMGRFMTQLFGSKREPWVEGPGGPERTQITEPSGDELDPDNDEKTTLIEEKQQVRALTATVPQGRAATAQTAPGIGQTGEVASLSASAAATDWNHDSRAGRQSPRPYEAPSRTPQNGSMPAPVSAPMSTLAGTGMSPVAQRIPQRPETEPGSKPLDGMGWQSNPAPAFTPQPADGGATRLPSEYQDGKVPSLRASRSWIILAILMLVGLGAGVLIAMQSS